MSTENLIGWTIVALFAVGIFISLESVHGFVETLLGFVFAIGGTALPVLATYLISH